MKKRRMPLLGAFLLPLLACSVQAARLRTSGFWGIFATKRHSGWRPENLLGAQLSVDLPSDTEVALTAVRKQETNVPSYLARGKQKRIHLEGELARAGAYFPGYFRDTRLSRAYLSVNAASRVRLWGSISDSEWNIAGDPLNTRASLLGSVLLLLAEPWRGLSRDLSSRSSRLQCRRVWALAARSCFLTNLRGGMK
ncbi:MAG: hypothetical protein B1H03_01560 [Planctomycetales bacterium 4484_113]|nr:MAG: hypothetical protein B1H03_01560 [Planctomycetales bacterium 4484_113]